MKMVKKTEGVTGWCVLPAHSPTLENLFGNSRLVLSFRQGQVLVTLSNKKRSKPNVEARGLARRLPAVCMYSEMFEVKLFIGGI
jgi:hypothetical protein